MDKEAQDLAQAVLKYNSAIEECKNDPTRLFSFCTATGNTLDTLYNSMVEKAYEVFGSKVEGFKWSV